MYMFDTFHTALQEEPRRPKVRVYLPSSLCLLCMHICVGTCCIQRCNKSHEGPSCASTCRLYLRERRGTTGVHACVTLHIALQQEPRRRKKRARVACMRTCVLVFLNYHYDILVHNHTCTHTQPHTCANMADQQSVRRV